MLPFGKPLVFLPAAPGIGISELDNAVYAACATLFVSEVRIVFHWAVNSGTPECAVLKRGVIE